MKTRQNSFRVVLVAATGLILTLCTDDGPSDPTPKRIIVRPGADAQLAAQVAFMQVEPGMEIVFEEGLYEFTSQLSMDDKTDVRVLGAGRDKTIFSFKDQTESGEGVLATNCSKILFKDFTIRDAKGDALKAKGCTGITFKNVAAIWSGEPRTENGSYGLYPVQCTDVLIDSCYVFGASDAGIYVGQSTNAIVRSSVAEGNVAGIEIENTKNADVYGNELFDNTGGILVFDLPDVTQVGRKTRVFHNNCHDNNRTNFAPKGNTVASVPPGTGVMLLSTRDVEVFDNEISNNMFAGIILASYLMIGEPTDSLFNALYSDIYIHDNIHRMDGTLNLTGQSPIGALIAGILQVHGFAQPHILMDNLTGGAICIEEAEGTTFVNLHAETLDPVTGKGDPDNDLWDFACEGEKLEPVDFESYGEPI